MLLLLRRLLLGWVVPPLPVVAVADVGVDAPERVAAPVVVAARVLLARGRGRGRGAGLAPPAPAADGLREEVGYCEEDEEDGQADSETDAEADFEGGGHGGGGGGGWEDGAGWDGGPGGGGCAAGGGVGAAAEFDGGGGGVEAGGAGDEGDLVGVLGLVWGGGGCQSVGMPSASTVGRVQVARTVGCWAELVAIAAPVSVCASLLCHEVVRAGTETEAVGQAEVALVAAPGGLAPVCSRCGARYLAFVFIPPCVVAS